MKPTVLVTTPIAEAYRRALEERYELTFDAGARDGVRAVVASGDFRGDEATMDAMPQLGLIACIGAGYDGIDLAAAARRGIKVANTAGANASAVADFTIGLLLSLVRRINEAERLVRAGAWRGERAGRLVAAPGLTGRRVGVVGMGAIGRKIASRLAAFETEIGYTGPSAKDDVSYRFFENVTALAEWADILILAHRASAANRHLVNAAVLRALGPRGFLVNISRGSAVDEEALIEAIETRAIAGAALDVFEHEPQVRPDLLSLGETVLTPHIAGGSQQALDAMFAVVGANLDAFFEGRPLPNEVSV